MTDDIWLKRGLFKEWVSEAKAKLHARSNASVAPIMELAATSLNKYLGKSSTHKPSNEALKLLGDFLGKDYRQLLDDPEQAPPGVSEELWASLSDKKRIVAVALLDDLKTIPEGEEEAYATIWKQAVRLGRARMDAEGKGGRNK